MPNRAARSCQIRSLAPPLMAPLNSWSPIWKQGFSQTDELSDDPTRDELLVKINLGELTFDNLLETLISKEGKEDVIWLLKDAPGLSTNAMEHLLASETNRILTRLLLEQDVSVKNLCGPYQMAG